jgi:hypothetical protein
MNFFLKKNKEIRMNHKSSIDKNSFKKLNFIFKFKKKYKQEKFKNKRIIIITEK